MLVLKHYLYEFNCDFSYKKSLFFLKKYMYMYNDYSILSYNAKTCNLQYFFIWKYISAKIEKKKLCIESKSKSSHSL